MNISLTQSSSLKVIDSVDFEQGICKYFIVTTCLYLTPFLRYAASNNGVTRGYKRSREGRRHGAVHSYASTRVSVLSWTPAQRSLSEVHYILPMFLWPPYSLAQVNGGSRNFYTWWNFSLIREVTTWIFSWSSLNYRVGQKVTKFDEIWRIFRPHPQTFCSHARTRQNIVILKKNLLSIDGCSTMCATFGKLWPTNP